MCIYKFITSNIISINRTFLLFYKRKTFHYVPKVTYLIKSEYTNRCVGDKHEELNFLKTSDENIIEESNSFQRNNEAKNKLSERSSNQNETRFNEINLQMLSNNLYNQIFGKKCSDNSYKTDENILSIKQELSKFGINAECASEMPNVDISIPALHGQDIEEHFKEIAQDQVQPYVNVINKLLKAQLPSIPEQFIFQEGWTRYTDSGYESVDYPQEEGLVYDVEVCMKNGPLPTLATAVGASSWYSWVSKHLFEGMSSRLVNKRVTPEILIPLESSKDDNGFDLTKFQQTPKIVVGHNVSFDRVRVKEQYWLNASATRFLDTMSLHVCVSGTSSYQRAVLKSKSASVENEQLNSISSLNNLVDVYKLYCGEVLDKKHRDIFIEGELHDVKEHFNELMSYCAMDAMATFKVLKVIFPMFIERFPHPATLAGMLELGSAYLPVNHNWNRYIEEAETIYEDLNSENKACLSRRADRACRLLIDDKYKKNPWMWDEDWSVMNIKVKKGYEKIYFKQKEESTEEDEKKELKVKFKYLEETRQFLPKKMTHMPGYPNWYRKLCHKQNSIVNLFPKVQKISTSMLVTPKLLNLTWEGYPLHHIKEHGWGFLVPFESEDFNTKLPLEQIIALTKSNKALSYDENDESKLYFNVEKELNEIPSNQLFSNRLRKKKKVNEQPDANLDNCCYFFKLPHKDGLFFNVGNPLAKDFLNKFSENVLAGIDTSASRILEISKLSSYWKNNRDRILSQLVIWLNNDSRRNKILNNIGAIVPQIVVSGTVTRRAVEPTWMTASNAHRDRIGSELRGMINAPLNYSIVGADVDSQELWIASIIGDAFSKSIKIQGGTPFSWMTLIGSKSEGTDMHSVTAKAIGISRDQAKVINYARIYGAGQKFAERLLKQFNPTMTDKEANLKSKKMFSMTKGQKFYRLKKDYLSDSFIDKLYTTNETYKIAQLYGKTREEVFEKGKWVGGSESAMFNSLEEIAGHEQPATPFLNARLSRALAEEANEKHLPTKINWVVQSAAVDFLHLALVCMRWLMKDKARLCLSFHDEVRYLVPSKYKYNAASAMHVTNLLVRCFFVSRLKMNDLPMSVAFFTAVEVDSALRKEATQDCKTPSNPHGLQEGYGIPYGESLNVWTAIEKSKGCVGLLKTTNKSDT